MPNRRFLHIFKNKVYMKEKIAFNNPFSKNCITKKDKYTCAWLGIGLDKKNA